jgi:hypothetical protein
MFVHELCIAALQGDGTGPLPARWRKRLDLGKNLILLFLGRLNHGTPHGLIVHHQTRHAISAIDTGGDGIILGQFPQGLAGERAVHDTCTADVPALN